MVFQKNKILIASNTPRPTLELRTKQTENVKIMINLI